jgi:hypothetical protein
MLNACRIVTSHNFMENDILRPSEKMFTKRPTLKKDKGSINEKFCKLRVRFKQAYYYYYYYYPRYLLYAGYLHLYS